MVATSLPQSQSTFRGILPFDPSRDLGAVARLLEEAFRDENAMPFSQVPLVREVGIFLWTLNYMPVFPENISGFVWAEDNKIVGNLTLTRDEGWTDRYVISNVAVQRDYRRKGIARQLMRAALDELRSHLARWALLNVRPNNPGAVQLYRDLGFEEIETRGEWELTSSSNLRLIEERTIGEIRPLRWADQRGVIELLRAVTPDKVKQFRKLDTNPSWLYWEDRVTEIVSDFFVGQRTQRWVVEQNGKIGALVTIHGQRLASPHRIDIQVHPDLRGRFESQLVAFALEELAKFPARPIRASGTSTHSELIAALEAQGFKMNKGLTFMALQF